MSDPTESGAVVAPLPEIPDEGLLRQMLAAQKREARQFLQEVLQMRGLMPLLMKPRNGGAWTRDERAELLRHLRQLSRLSPYLLFLVLPGSALILPAYAWWLDRRRQRRRVA